MTGETNIKIAGSVLVGMIVTLHGHTYKMNSDLGKELRQEMSGMEERISKNLHNRDNRGDIDQQRMRADVDATLVRQWTEMLRLYGELRGEVLRSNQLSNEQMAKVTAQMDALREKINEISANLKVILSDKGRR